MSTDKEQFVREILTKEYDRVSQSVANLFFAGEKVMGVGVALISAGLTYGLKEKIYVILLLLPIALSGVLLYAAHLITELRAVAGYKRHLEERINERAGEDVLLWESNIVKSRHRVIGQKFMYLIYAVLFIACAYISLSTAWQYYPRFIFYGLSFIVLALSAGLLISIRELYQAFNLTYRLAQLRTLRE